MRYKVFYPSLLFLVSLLFVSHASATVWTEDWSNGLNDWTISMGQWSTSYYTDPFTGTSAVNTTSGAGIITNNIGFVPQDIIIDFNKVANTGYTLYSQFGANLVNMGSIDGLHRIFASGASNYQGAYNTWYRVHAVHVGTNWHYIIYDTSMNVLSDQTFAYTAPSSDLIKLSDSSGAGQIVSWGQISVSDVPGSLSARNVSYVYSISTDKREYNYNCGVEIQTSYNSPLNGWAAYIFYGDSYNNVGETMTNFEASGIGSFTYRPYSSIVNLNGSWSAVLFNSSNGRVAYTNFSITNSTSCINNPGVNNSNNSIPNNYINNSNGWIYNNTANWSNIIANGSGLLNGSVSSYCYNGTCLGNGSGYGIRGLISYINSVNDSITGLNYSVQNNILLTFLPDIIGAIPSKVQFLVTYYLLLLIVLIILGR